MRGHLRRWGVVYLLVVMFAGSWAGQLVAMTPDIQEKGWHEFWSATMENWQSEFLQLAVQALLVVGYAHAVFTKSTEDARRLEAKVDELARRVNQGGIL